MTEYSNCELIDKKKKFRIRITKSMGSHDFHELKNKIISSNPSVDARIRKNSQLFH